MNVIINQRAVNAITSQQYASIADVQELGGNNRPYTAARFTPKGVEWVAVEWAKQQIKEVTQ